MIIIKKKCSSYKVLFSKEKGLEYELYCDKKKGTNIFIVESVNFKAIIHTPLEISESSFNVALNNIDDIALFSKNFTSTFTLFLLNHKTNDFYVSTDLLGIQAVFYKVLEGKKLVFSPLIERILREDGSRLEVSRDGLFHFLSFGYCFENAPFLYKKIYRVYQRKLLHFDINTRLVNEIEYIKLPGINSSKKTMNIDAVHVTLVNSLRKVRNPYIGVTAGLDSLIVSACLNTVSKRVKSGNFGYLESTDVKYGYQLAKRLNFDYSHQTLCSKLDFEHYLGEVAYYSSGMATASYVDMLKFVDNAIGADETFVMGEAGESVRDFFVDNSLIENYLTPKKALQSILDNNFKKELLNYPKGMLSHFKSEYLDTQEEFYVDFYRNARLPGNFSLRTLIIQSKVNKVSPFLDKEFIDYTYDFKLENFSKSRLHRNLVEVFYPELSSLIDNNVIVDSQIWSKRFKEGIGDLIITIIEENFVDIGISKKSLISLIKENISKPSRSIFLIFRVLSLIYFLNKINSNHHILK
jgi:asparagine synthetase B (glutamine-hydrolysing)